MEGEAEPGQDGKVLSDNLKSFFSRKIGHEIFRAYS